KTIGYLGAIVLIFNASTGYCIPYTPTNFGDPGWCFSALVFCLFALVSGFSALFIIEAMQAIPGNSNFQGDVEYATLINFYFDPISHLVGQAFLYGAIQSNAIQSVVLSSQATDNMLIDIFGRTCGLSGSLHWVCKKTVSQTFPSPFEDQFMIFTLGFLVVLLLIVPLGLLNLDDNMWIQYASFFISLLIILQWITSSNNWDTSRMPAFAPLGIEYGQVVGTIMLNLAVTTIVPSWINLKSKDVNVQQTVWISMSLITVTYVTAGMLLALSYDTSNTDNILTLIQSFGKPTGLSKATVYAFAFVMLVPSIPVNMIISKNNLIQNSVLSNNLAIIVSYVLPWIVAIPLQTNTFLLPFQTWTSLIFVSCANFIIPVIIYFKCLFFR
ncbi:hypothetical protein EDD86DRAFT_178635, partial [Gorgonomyces haynaldii]